MDPSPSINTIWQSQCEATKRIRRRYGLERALDYLVGEKLLQYAQFCEHDAKLAPALAAFVAEVKRLFSMQELRDYLDGLEHQKALEAELPQDEEGPLDSLQARQAVRERVSWVKAMVSGSAS
jgi:hypothetical protein